ncbi:2-hydroxychromene-2-carboxylate isomerase [Polyangium sp. y55x31]|uniref:2-hydroxychromene-2-carboxylate isomerase n=1 Tax=Polyangium sp. y55x31 TaxID=3042688 RepID=UPI0024828E6D|nr:2-hydroxychromene-2-carboxylate isomerase [Polyangium sp. y55x31]MDI1481020.1 2-hydroxychromene-2-carboxylate isomerase [Polyangium sp. y55x31]
MRTVRFYFDVISPYVWLAWSQVPEVEARTGARFDLEPVLFAGLLLANENKGPAEIPSKRVHMLHDVARWAMMLKRPYAGPPAHPFNPLKAQRMCAALEDPEARRRLAGALIVATWENGRDLMNDAELSAIADDVGLDGAALLAATEEKAVKDRLRKNTEQAIAKGVFGVPTFVVDDQLFWGNDRLGFLETYLAGGLRIDKAEIEERLARPRAADRKNV